MINKLSEVVTIIIFFPVIIFLNLFLLNLSCYYIFFPIIKCFPLLYIIYSSPLLLFVTIFSKFPSLYIIFFLLLYSSQPKHFFLSLLFFPFFDFLIILFLIVSLPLLLSKITFLSISCSCLCYTYNSL